MILTVKDKNQLSDIEQSVKQINRYKIQKDGLAKLEIDTPFYLERKGTKPIMVKLIDKRDGIYWFIPFSKKPLNVGGAQVEITSYQKHPGAKGCGHIILDCADYEKFWLLREGVTG